MANSEQTSYWNDQAGPRWVAMQEILDHQLQPFGAEAAERAGVSTGERVIDIGCGCGATTIELARRVGDAGNVCGLDVSEPMLARAAERSAREGLERIRYVRADAQTYDFSSAAFDVVFSRFGVMFFEDPTAAFANLASAMEDGGRLTFACWQAAENNPWMRVPTIAAMEHVEIEVAADPHAPGPFAFSDSERVKGILADAGLQSIEAHAFEPEVTLAGGADLDQAALFMTQLGPAARPLQRATDELRATVVAAVREALQPFTRDGAVVMPSAAWIFTARR